MQHKYQQNFSFTYTAFASICYHYSELQRNMHQNCLLRGSTTFTDLPEYIWSKFRIAYPWNARSDTPKFTGASPHILILL